LPPAGTARSKTIALWSGALRYGTLWLQALIQTSLRISTSRSARWHAPWASTHRKLPFRARAAPVSEPSESWVDRPPKLRSEGGRRSSWPPGFTASSMARVRWFLKFRLPCSSKNGAQRSVPFSTSQSPSFSPEIASPCRNSFWGMPSSEAPW